MYPLNFRPGLKLILVFAALALSHASAPAFAQQHEMLQIDPATGSVTVRFPPNTLAKPRFIPAPDDAEQRRIFASLIDEVAAPYIDFVERNAIYTEFRVKHPGKHFRARLIIDESSKDWTNEKINAEAAQDAGDDGVAIWTIRMFGGLFRRPELTHDGFSLLVCHEIGHHLAGFPFWPQEPAGFPLTVAAEGQADYFSVHSCLRRIWRNKDNAPPYAGPHGAKIELKDVPALVQAACKAQWPDQADLHLCYRIAMAGFSVGTLWGYLDQNLQLCETPDFPQPCFPRFDRPDRTQAPDTWPKHSRAQCRLDTYFAGALCREDFGPSQGGKVIPGKFGQFEHVPENSARARDEALARSCARHLGARPRCWFNPESVSQ